MVSLDYHVGFEREPKDLDAFLASRSYKQDSEDQDNSYRFYKSREHSIDIFYYPKEPEADEDDDGVVPDWKAQGFNVTSKLMISTKDFNAYEETQRIALAIAKEYDGVFYDSTHDVYYQANEL